jgi:hypothetical protein
MRTLRSIRSGAAWRAGAPAVDAGQERPPGDPGSTDASLEHPANVCRAHRDSCSLPLLPSRVPVGSSANPKGLPASGGCQTSPPEGRFPTYLRWNGLQATVPPEVVTLKNSVPADWPTRKQVDPSAKNRAIQRRRVTIGSSRTEPGSALPPREGPAPRRPGGRHTGAWSVRLRRRSVKPFARSEPADPKNQRRSRGGERKARPDNYSAAITAIEVSRQRLSRTP